MRETGGGEMASPCFVFSPAHPRSPDPAIVARAPVDGRHARPSLLAQALDALQLFGRGVKKMRGEGAN